MKLLNYGLTRSICALIVGILLIVFPTYVPKYLVMAIGCLFIIPGLIFLFVEHAKKKKSPWGTTVSSIGSILFGFWLILMPNFFLRIFIYVLGAILVLAGVHQISRFTMLRDYVKVSAGYYVFPALILLAGLVVLANPFKTTQIANIILGVSAIIYAIVEIIRIIKFHKVIEKMEQSVIDVEVQEVVEELPAPTDEVEEIITDEETEKENKQE